MIIGGLLRQSSSHALDGFRSVATVENKGVAHIWRGQSSPVHLADAGCIMPPDSHDSALSIAPIN